METLTLPAAAPAQRLVPLDVFRVLGSNAIARFGSGSVAGTLAVTGVGASVNASLFAPLASRKNASPIDAVANLAGLFVLLAWMYRRRLLRV